MIGGGIASVLGLGHITQGQVELDKLARQTRAIAEIGEPAWLKHQDAMTEIGNKYGIDPKEMTKGAKSWLELGNSIESYIENAQVAGKTSKITGISIGDQMTETSALVKAFGYDPKDTEIFRQFEPTR